jgi:hypothetical protein
MAKTFYSMKYRAIRWVKMKRPIKGEEEKKKKLYYYYKKKEKKAKEVIKKR